MFPAYRRAFDVQTITANHLPTTYRVDFCITPPMMIVARQCVAVRAPLALFSVERNTEIPFLINVNYSHAAAIRFYRVSPTDPAGMFISHVDLLFLANNQPVRCQRHIAYRHNQPPHQNEAADHTAQNKAERKNGDSATKGAAAGHNPKAHPMDAEGQTAENPEPYIIQGSVLHAGRLEDADEQ